MKSLPSDQCVLWKPSPRTETEIGPSLVSHPLLGPNGTNSVEELRVEVLLREKGIMDSKRAI